MWEFIVQNREEVRTVAMIIAVVVAMISSFAAWRAASNARKAAEGKLYSEMLDEYRTEDMADCLKALFDFEAYRKAHPTDPGGWEIEVCKNKYDMTSNLPGNPLLKCSAIENARRKVDHYFYKAAMMYKRGYARKPFLVALSKLSGIRTLAITVQLGLKNVELYKDTLIDKYDPEHVEIFNKQCGLQIQVTPRWTSPSTPLSAPSGPPAV